MHHSFTYSHILHHLWSIKTSLDSLLAAGHTTDRSALMYQYVSVQNGLWPAGWAFVVVDVVSACVFLYNVLWGKAVQSLTSRLSSSLVTVITWLCGVEAAVKVKLHADKSCEVKALTEGVCMWFRHPAGSILPWTVSMCQTVSADAGSLLPGSSPACWHRSYWSPSPASFQQVSQSFTDTRKIVKHLE